MPIHTFHSESVTDAVTSSSASLSPSPILSTRHVTPQSQSHANARQSVIDEDYIVPLESIVIHTPETEVEVKVTSVSPTIEDDSTPAPSGSVLSILKSMNGSIQSLAPSHVVPPPRADSLTPVGGNSTDGEYPADIEDSMVQSRDASPLPFDQLERGTSEGTVEMIRRHSKSNLHHRIGSPIYSDGSKSESNHPPPSSSTAVVVVKNTKSNTDIIHSIFGTPVRSRHTNEKSATLSNQTIPLLKMEQAQLVQIGNKDLTNEGSSDANGVNVVGQRSTKVSNKYRRIRRNPAMQRQLQKFKRIKRHVARYGHGCDDEECEENGNNSGAANDDLLYDTDSVLDPSSIGGIRREMFRLSAFCTCESFAMTELIDFIEGSTEFDGSMTLYGDVLLIKQKHLRREIFVFEYGVVVFFNFHPTKEANFLNLMKRFEHGPLAKYECEDFDFSYSTEYGKSGVSNDEIILGTHTSLEKLSVAFAVAQCTKLSVYEERIAAESDSSKHLSETLAKTGSIGLTQREISKKLGTLFAERNNVNLHFDVLDSPEFFWQEDKMKHVYDSLFQYLELGKRVETLNKRLGIMKEFFDLLNSQMERKHSNNLEWIVIWLIVFEVIVTVFWEILLKDVFGLFTH